MMTLLHSDNNVCDIVTMVKSDKKIASFKELEPKIVGNEPIKRLTLVSTTTPFINHV